ncbi:MAG: hypothetical protein Q9217_006430 [Psora testacea]
MRYARRKTRSPRFGGGLGFDQFIAKGAFQSVRKARIEITNLEADANDRGYNFAASVVDDDLPSLELLLRDMTEAQASQQTGENWVSLTVRSDKNRDRSEEKDWKEIGRPGPGLDNCKESNPQDDCTTTAGREPDDLQDAPHEVGTGGITGGSNGSTHREQSGQQSPLSTLPTSVAESQVGSDPFLHPSLLTFRLRGPPSVDDYSANRLPPCRNSVHSQRRELPLQTFPSHHKPSPPLISCPRIRDSVGKGPYATTTGSTVGNKKVEAEANDEEEGPRRVSKVMNVSLRPGTKMVRPANGRDPSLKRRVQRPRLSLSLPSTPPPSPPLSSSSSSPLSSSSEEDIDSEAELDASIYKPTKLDRTSHP